MPWRVKADITEPVRRYLRARRRVQKLKAMEIHEDLQARSAKILAKRTQVLEDIPDEILDKLYEAYANECRADEDARESSRERCITCKHYWANMPRTVELLRAAFGHHVVYEEASGKLAEQLKADIQPCPQGVGPPIMDMRESTENKWPVQIIGNDTVGPLICTDFEEVKTWNRAPSK